MSGANYNGRQPNNTSYIKTFVEGDLATTNLWQNSTYLGKNILKPLNTSLDLYIPGNIIIGGQIIYDTMNSTNTNTNTNTSTINYQYSSENEITQLKNEITQLKNEMKQLKNLLSANIK